MKKKNLKRILTFFVTAAVTFSALCVPCSAAAKTKVSAPKKVTAKVTQGVNIKVSWQKVNGADGYVVYAKRNGAKNYKAVKTTGGRTFSYTYQKLSTYKKYYFKIKAFKRINGKKYYSGFSKYIGAKTSKPYISAPKLSSISLVDTTTLKVNWKKVSSANGYALYAKESGKDYKLIAKTGSGTSSFTHKNLKSNTKYYYKIKAIKTYGKKQYYSDYSGMLGRKTTNSLLHLTKPYSLGEYSKVYVDDAKGIDLANDHYSTGMVIYHYISHGGYAIFDLKNKYKTLSFTAFVPTGDEGDEKTLYIYADDELVKQINIKFNDLPKKFTLNIDNCAKLEFKIADDGWKNKINLANITVAK